MHEMNNIKTCGEVYQTWRSSYADHLKLEKFGVHAFTNNSTNLKMYATILIHLQKTQTMLVQHI